MKKLISIGCDVRILVNLDVQKALFCGYSVDDIIKRVSDLCAICDEFKDFKNFNIAIESTGLFEPILILGDILISKNYNFTTKDCDFETASGNVHEANYRCAAWSSNQNEILACSSAFDRMYMDCLSKNRQLMQFLHLDSYSQLIYYIVQEKLIEASEYE